MYLAARALLAPETLTDEERKIVDEGTRAFHRQQNVIDQLWLAAILHQLPGAIDA